MKLKDTARLLVRECEDTKDELAIASSIFLTTKNRTRLHNCPVLCRYSCLPFYNELEADLKHSSAKMLTTLDQHNYIARFEWYKGNKLLSLHTFQTWFDLVDIPENQFPFVVKGVTNSKKNQWNRLMYAKDKTTAVIIACDLMTDGLIGQQDIIVRKYEPLVTFETGINGQPFTNEWRVFCWGEKILVIGYYWTQLDNSDKVLSDEGKVFAEKIARIISKDDNFPKFVCFDIAEVLKGGWVLVEINDAQMSGLSYCDPVELYKNLGEVEL